MTFAISRNTKTFVAISIMAIICISYGGFLLAQLETLIGAGVGLAVELAKAIGDRNKLSKQIDGINTEIGKKQKQKAALEREKPNLLIQRQQAWDYIVLTRGRLIKAKTDRTNTLAALSMANGALAHLNGLSESDKTAFTDRIGGITRRACERESASSTTTITN